MLKLPMILLVAFAAVKCEYYVEDVFGALERVLNYVMENHEFMNIDALFGLVLEQAQLQSIITFDDVTDQNVEKKLKLLENKTNEVINLVKPHIKASHKNTLFLETLMIPRIWRKNLTFEHYLLDTSLEKNNCFAEIDTYKKYLNFLAKGTFVEEVSDRCFVELLKSQRVCCAPHDCSVSPMCTQYMILSDRIGPNYGVTHRLLFLQTARAQKCNLEEKLVNNYIRSYCSYIFWEASKNSEYGFTEELDDLFLEQVTLCGYEGFAEFFSDDFIEHILSTQSKHGCFTVRTSTDATDEEVGRKRSKREANFIKYGCSDHSTGLGASSLSLILRYLLQKET